MEGSLEQELSSALQEARAARSRLDRHHARGLLIPLGLLIAAERGDEERRQVLAWQADLPEESGEAWKQAVSGELSLACAEHVQSVDPRFLSHPQYDFAYTQEARERLEARLVAALELGLEVPETLLRGVHRADSMLEPFLRGREGRLGPN